MKNKIIGLVGKLHSKLHTAEDEMRYSEYRKKYSISETFKFYGHDVVFFGDGEIICGQNSHINGGSKIFSHPPYKVVIGENVMIGYNVTIYNKMEWNKKRGCDVVIGDNVKIGSNVMIICASIGKNSIIGANAVVTRDIGKNMLGLGVPARGRDIRRCLNDSKNV